MESSIHHIYRNGRHYDRLFTDGTSDPTLPFWLKQAERYGGPILELACGTGRLSIPLAREGFDVTGIDNSDEMLSEARRKSSGTAVDWVNVDMRDFDLAKLFGLIIIPGNSLCHLLSISDFESCLSSVKKHLAPNGKFIIDVFVPSIKALLNKPGERSPFAEYDDPDGKGRVVITESSVYEADTQIRRVKTYHRIPGVDGEIEGNLDMRMYFPQELDALLKYNGFTIDAKYGNYEMDNFTADSPKQLVVCSRAS